MLRFATVSDEPFLRLMLFEAAARPEHAGRSLPDVLAEPRIARYIDGWGRPGDLGMVAEEGGKAVGAAWLRIHSGNEFAPDYEGEPVAQLAIGVVAAHRGRGWGRRLLERLLDEAEKRGVPEVQLSVGVSNTPAVRLYQSLGFEVLISDGRSARMALRLDPEAS